MDGLSENPHVIKHGIGIGGASRALPAGVAHEQRSSRGNESTRPGGCCWAWPKRGREDSRPEMGWGMQFGQELGQASCGQGGKEKKKQGGKGGLGRVKTIWAESRPRTKRGERIGLCEFRQKQLKRIGLDRKQA